MNVFERFFYILDSLRMTEPELYGWYHILWLVIIALTITFFVIAKKRGIKISENLVFGSFGITALILEILKQTMWTMNFNSVPVTYSYQWYAAPFQFCDMPLYITLTLLFVKNKKVREYLCCFLGFYSILSMVLAMAYPAQVYTSQVLINVHTMFVHGGGLLVCAFVLINHLVTFNVKSVLKGYVVFCIAAGTALLLDIVFYNSGILDGATFNMFYISPYFPCSLPVLNLVYDAVPYLLFLFVYFFAFFVGGFVVLGIYKLGKMCGKKKEVVKN